MNKYRNVQLPEAAFAASQSPEPIEGTFDGGIVLNKSPQDIELNQTPGSDLVRVEQGGLRQDYDVDAVSTAAATKVLALGEHKYVITGDTIYEALFRLYLTSLAAATVEIDTWDGSSWVAAVNTGGTDSLTLARVLASWKTFFSSAFFATGGGIDIVRWIRTSTFTAQTDEFPSAEYLTAEGQDTAAPVVPAAAANDSYFIHYSVTFTGPSESGALIVLEFLDDADAVVDSITYDLPVSSDTARSLVYAHEIKKIIDVIATGEDTKIKLTAITQSPVTRIKTLTEAPADDWRGVKGIAREALADLYTFNYVLQGDGSATLLFYYDTGAGWVLWDTIVGAEQGTFTNGLTQAGLGIADDFRMVLSSVVGDFIAVSVEVEWSEPYEVSVKGFRVTGDADVTYGVTYDTEGSIVNKLLDVPKSIASVLTGTADASAAATLVDGTAPFGAAGTQDGRWVQITDGTGVGQLRKITTNTSTSSCTISVAWDTIPDITSDYNIGTPTYAEARYLAIFNNRLLLLQDGGDVQKIGWSKNGEPDVLFGDGAGETIRAAYSSDPIDPLMGFASLSSSVGALFRKRSIERVAATGILEPANAFFKWIEEIGTESPFSITEVPGGIMFLGHDKMVYYLTETSFVSVGQPIQEEFYNTVGELGSVEGEYDPIAQDYILVVPSAAGSDTAVGWFFDMDRYLRERVQVWQRHTRAMNRPAIINGTDVYFVGGDYVTYKFNRDAVEDSAYWESPTLNRKDPEAEYTLHRVVLRFETNAVTPVIIIEGSGDGGITWTNGLKTSITLVDTQGGLLRVAQGFGNVTGSDLRFRIRFDDTGKVLLRSWRAELVQRSAIGDDI